MDSKNTPRKVKVAELRRLVDALFRSVNVDSQALRSVGEKARWFGEVERAAVALASARCPRASVYDVDQVAKALAMKSARVLEVSASLSSDLRDSVAA